MRWKISTGSHPSWESELPSDKLNVEYKLLHMFFNMLYERQKIWYNRYVLEKEHPWSEDEILSNNKFCNTYRILDRNSQWEVKNITMKKGLSVEKYLWNVIFFRLFNQPDFFEYLATNTLIGIPTPKQYNADNFHQYMQNYRQTGGNPFTNAYLTNSVACPGQTRDWCFAYRVIPTLIEKFPEILEIYLNNGTPEEFCKKLMEIPSVSDFLSYEFYVSVCFRERLGLDTFGNTWTHDLFSNVGPGASLGLRLLFPNKKTNKEQYQALKTLRKIAPAYIKQHFPDFIFTKWDKKQGKFVASKEFNLTLLTMEHGCCEFQKYWKMSIKQGKQRSKFIPKGANRPDFFLY